MVAQKIFISCMATLIIFNLLFFLTGYNTSWIAWDSVTGVFITLGIIAVIVSALPLIDSESTMKWFMHTIIICSIMYSFSFTILGYPINVGIGLASNLANMFSSDINTIAFMPWLFFTFTGLLGVICGVISVSGGE